MIDNIMHSVFESDILIYFILLLISLNWLGNRVDCCAQSRHQLPTKNNNITSSGRRSIDIMSFSVLFLKQQCNF